MVIGNRGNTEINARIAMNKDAAILGMALNHATPAQLAGIHAALVEGLRNGSLRPVIAQELPLAQAARSHEVVMEAGHHGKVVLVPVMGSGLELRHFRRAPPESAAREKCRNSRPDPD